MGIITNPLFSILTVCYGVIFTRTVVLHTHVKIWPYGLTETDTHKQISRPHTLNHTVDLRNQKFWFLHIILNYAIVVFLKKI